jgi:hypothetical protein
VKATNLIRAGPVSSDDQLPDRRRVGTRGLQRRLDLLVKGSPLLDERLHRRHELLAELSRGLLLGIGEPELLEALGHEPRPLDTQASEMSRVIASLTGRVIGEDGRCREKDENKSRRN